MAAFTIFIVTYALDLQFQHREKQPLADHTKSFCLNSVSKIKPM